MTIKKSLSIILIILLLKASLDFLSDRRELNSLLIGGMALFALVLARGWQIMSLVSGVLLASGMLQLAYATLYNFNYSQSLKILFPILFGVVMYQNLIRLDRIEHSYVGKIYIRSVLLLFVANYVLSIFLADPGNRLFFVFEHANLLGSYLVFAFSTYLVASGYCRKYESALISASTWATTSTGSLISSALFWLQLKKISSSQILVAGIILFGIIIISYYATYNYFPVFFEKVFLPFEVIAAGRLEALKSAALSSISLQEFAGDVESSFLWRMYAYFIFVDYYINGSILQLILGRGVGGYLDAWNGYMPHNDFVLVLIDFGISGFLVVVIFLLLAFRSAKKVGPHALIALVAVLSRLLVENNIYSSYLFSNLAIFFAFLFAVGNPGKHRESRVAGNLSLVHRNKVPFK